jgi:hypothetical protein
MVDGVRAEQVKGEVSALSVFDSEYEGDGVGEIRAGRVAAKGEWQGA